LADLNKRISSVTVYNCIHKLRRMTNLIAPQRDVSWLNEIENDLALEMRPRSKAGRFVLSHVLFTAGLTLMAEAESSSRSMIKRARQYRNGLMIAFLALHQIRLKNFKSLELGRSLVKTKRTWWIKLSASETKERRPDERPVDDQVAAAIDRYLSYYRPVLARRDDPPPALWLSSHNGRPLSCSAVANAVDETTLSTVGIKVSPHLFRTAGVSTAAILCRDNPHLGSALMHHHDPRIAERNYNRACSLSAGMAFQEIIRRYQSG
jgi:hypothetical protein